MLNTGVPYSDQNKINIFSLFLWSSGQTSWLQIHMSRVRFPALPNFLRGNGSERGPLSLVRITEELLERKVAAAVYKTEINGSVCMKSTAYSDRKESYRFCSLAVHKVSQILS
jgi:hypothetical protein